MTSTGQRTAAAPLTPAPTAGRRLTVYRPGMFWQNGCRGRYPALSLTGRECRLKCDHCAGRLLETMIPVNDGDHLVTICRRLAGAGNHGVLLSGGCDAAGRLPWERFFAAIGRVKSTTNLTVSIHAGNLDLPTARALKRAGVDLALVDVIGDAQTYRRVYHLDGGLGPIHTTLEALAAAGLPIVPHVICGLDYGRIRGEYRALETIAALTVAAVVVVSLMPLSATPMAAVTPPPAEAVTEVLAAARRMMPATPLSLGCARRRGDVRLERCALEVGIDRLALASDEALAHARRLGLRITFQDTCCALAPAVVTAGGHP